MYDMNMDMRQDMDIDRNTEIPTSWLKALSDIAPSTMRMRMSMLLPHVLCFLDPFTNMATRRNMNHQQLWHHFGDRAFA